MDEFADWTELDEAIGNPEWARHPGKPRPAVVYRGLSRSSHRNVSSLSRLEGDYPSLERHLLRNFRKYAHRQDPGPTTWDWLALGQHHGLPTRLLDWTFSPLVALHFATASWPDDDAVLWAVDCEAAHAKLPSPLRDALDEEGSVVFTTELLAEHAPDMRALDRLTGEAPFALFFEPPSLHERIINQAAVLSVISDPTCHMEDWLEEHTDSWRVWRIPAALKREARERLDQSQITERLLVPGLDGLAAWLRRYYSPRWTPAAGDGSMMSSRVAST